VSAARTESDTAESPEEAITLQEFLASFGPNKVFLINNLARVYSNSARLYNDDDIELFCDNERCQGVRSFKFETGRTEIRSDRSWSFEFFDYVCRNCQKTCKKFALAMSWDKRRNGAFCFRRAVKLGEYPPFGPPTPARMLRLIQEDRELFLIGRRAETQGMGIGAFAYYRRVVEEQKTRIFDKIIDVAKKLGTKDEQIAQLQQDRNKWSFEASAEALKDIMPRELFMDGQNPLMLLHRALSANLHERSDKECLELAETIRLVLIEFADRCAEILRDRNELTAAVKRLGSSRQSKA
jgi:hypothetical protein